MGFEPTIGALQAPALVHLATAPATGFHKLVLSGHLSICARRYCAAPLPQVLSATFSAGYWGSAGRPQLWDRQMKWRPISASVITPYAAISAIVLILPAHLGAQWTDLSTHWPDLGAGWIDGRLPRRGELQIGLSGQVSTLESRFTADGTKQPLTDVFAVDLNDPLLVPELVALDSTLVYIFSSLVMY